MPLSPRAQAFLAALRRRPAVPVAEVATAIREDGSTPYDVWLDFHQRYAGYEQPMGQDTAIWGIVHSDSYWIGSGKASVRREKNGAWSVICAEVHGSYDFRLHQDGSFRSFDGGGPCATFDVNVEQLALVWEVKKTGRVWTCIVHTKPVDLDRFRVAVQAEPVIEASDRFKAAWKGRDIICFENLDGSNRLSVWTPKDERDRMKQLLTRAG
jgi:hypothetical protein